MGLVMNLVRSAASRGSTWHPVPFYQDQMPQSMTLNYHSFAREGYGGNEIVFSAIEEIATSAAEPTMVAKSGKATIYQHPILVLLNRPNPFMGRYEFWAAVLMYYYIAGNAYAFKVRSGSGKVLELWLLRPDRVKIVPSATAYISHYEYWIGNSEHVDIPASDIIHFKTRNPYEDFYGMSPLKVIAPRIDTDNYIREFVKSHFTNGLIPGGILSLKGALDPEAKDALRERLHNQASGPRGWHEWLIVDNNEATFTATTMPLGQRGTVVPELDEINEARLAMPFGVPLSLIGARLGMSSSSYGNRKSDRESFWDETLSPKYKELASVLDLHLVPDFTGIDSVAFDLSDVRALQEDQDKVHARVRADYGAGLMPLETAQNKISLEESERDGLYLVPLNMVPTPAQVFEDALAAGEQIPPPRLTEKTEAAAPDLPEPSKAPAALPAPSQPANRLGRPRLEDDPLARELFEHGEKLRRENPRMTLEQVSSRVGVALSTYKRWRAAFGEDTSV